MGHARGAPGLNHFSKAVAFLTKAGQADLQLLPLHIGAQVNLSFEAQRSFSVFTKFQFALSTERGRWMGVIFPGSPDRISRKLMRMGIIPLISSRRGYVSSFWNFPDAGGRSGKVTKQEQDGQIRARWPNKSFVSRRWPRCPSN